MSISNLLMKRMERKYPERHRQTAIEYNDERNTFIRDKAKAKAAGITQWCVIGVAYITILTNAPLWVTLVTVGVFALHTVLVVYFTNRYQQEM